MKKLSFLIILFLFSCSDTETSKEQSELNRCINANISIIENSNMERLLEFPEVLGLPVKLDIDYIKSTFSELELEISKKKIIENPSNKNAEEYIKFLQETNKIFARTSRRFVIAILSKTKQIRVTTSLVI